jgi:protein pelota
MSKFFEALLDAVLRSFNFEVIKCILVASPGFLKDEFHTFMMQEMVRRDIKLLQENKIKFFKCPSHSGHKRALRDILGNPDITKQLENVKATGEVFSLNRFYDILREDTLTKQSILNNAVLEDEFPLFAPF